MTDPCNYEGDERRKECPFATAAADKAVKDVFAILGVNVDEPREVENFRKGLRWGETMYRFTSRGAMATAVIIAGLVVTAFLAGVAVKFNEFTRGLQG